MTDMLSTFKNLRSTGECVSDFTIYLPLLRWETPVSRNLASLSAENRKPACSWGGESPRAARSARSGPGQAASSSGASPGDFGLGVQTPRRSKTQTDLGLPLWPLKVIVLATTWNSSLGLFLSSSMLHASYLKGVFFFFSCASSYRK